MKRLLAIFLIITSFLCVFPVSAVVSADTKPIEVYYLGQKLDFAVPPQLIGGSTMVPMRTIFEALGYTIDWDAETKTVAAYLDDNIIALTIGEKDAYINGSPQPLSEPAVLVNGSTLVPLRFIGEASGYIVDWHEDKTITIAYSEELKAKLETRKKAYIEELNTIKSQLPILHANLFFYKSKDEFYSEMDSLIQSVPTLTDDQIKFELIRIVNTINDTHSYARLIDEMYLSTSFFEFDDGIYLINGAEAYSDFFGKKLTGINGYSIEEVRKRLTPIIPFDNPSISKDKFCAYLSIPSYLKLAGILRSYGNITLQFDNELLNLPVQHNTGSFASISAPSKIKCPSFFIKSGNYTSTYLKSQNAMYIQINACRDSDQQPFAEFAKDVFSEINKKNIDCLIIDVRDNDGGLIYIFNAFLREIQNSTKINRKKHLYLITGRKTFSAAVALSYLLENNTHITSIGEPTGGNPNMFGNPKILNLANLNMTLRYGTRYLEYNSKENSFKPDIIVPLKASSFFAGKDDFLEAVFEDMSK